MQPCSQPRYGFTLVSNPTSGLLLRVMIVFVPSRKNCVGRRGRSSSSRSPSTTSTSLRSTCTFSKRLAGLHDAPLPRIASELCGVSLMTGRYFGLLEPPMSQVHMNMCACRAFSERNRWPPWDDNVVPLQVSQRLLNFGAMAQFSRQDVPEG